MRRKLRHPRPELLDGLDEGAERFRRARLGHIGVGVKLVALDDVLFRLRARQDQDGDAAQLGVLPYLGQHFAPALLGHVQVQQDQLRSRDASVLPLPSQERERVFAVYGHAQVEPQPALAQGLPHQPHVAWVVFAQKHFNRSSTVGTAHGLVPFPPPALPREG